MSTVADRLGEEIGAHRRATGVAVWPALILVLAAALVGLMPTFATLGPKWLDSHTYSHGLLVAAISVWLLWLNRASIAATQPRPSLLALAALTAALFLWTLSWAAAMATGAEILFPGALWLAAASLLGLSGAWKLAFPIGYLYFAVPLWDAINSTLQGWTTAVVSVLLPVLGVPAFIQGNHVQIPAGNFEIAGGCSGLHFFIVALALAALYGYLYYGRWTRRLALLVVAAVGALIINWVRVTTIITAGHLTDMQSYLVQVDHYTFGWVLFGVALVPFYLFARRLERGDKPPERPAPMRGAGVGGARVPAARVALVALLLLTPALAWLRPVPAAASVEIDLPAVAGWQGPAPAVSGWAPIFEQAGGSAHGAYSRREARIEAYANWYASQAQGRELIGYGNRVEGDWGVESTAVRKLELDRGVPLAINEMIIVSYQGGRRAVWYWYQIGSRTEISPLRGKLWGGWQVMTGGHGAGLVAASAACQPDCDRAREQLEQWLGDAAGSLTSELMAAAEAATRE